MKSSLRAVKTCFTIGILSSRSSIDIKIVVSGPDSAFSVETSHIFAAEIYIRSFQGHQGVINGRTYVHSKCNQKQEYNLCYKMDQSLPH